MYTVYILGLSGKKHFYIGVTSNIILRLNQHISGKVKSTKNQNPKLIYKEEFSNKHDAWMKVKWYKSGVGREYIKINILGR